MRIDANNAQVESLREGVRRAYSAAAEQPNEAHPFPVGAQFARSLGYSQAQLSSLPSISTEAFSGVSNVSIFADIPARSCVLDLGCGAGLDSLIAARKSGPYGRVVGVDFSEHMLRRARRAATISGDYNIEFCQADAENLPLDAESIDVALVNGIFNLNPRRDYIFRELARVMRSGGVVYAAELILKAPLPREVRESEENWFA